MKLACSHLLKMHVYTASGTHVGKVKDISFDVDTGVVVEYFVSSLLHRSVSIAREQVVRYEEDRIIVEDRVVDEAEKRDTPLSFTSPDTLGFIEDNTP